MWQSSCRDGAVSRATKELGPTTLSPAGEVVTLAIMVVIVVVNAAVEVLVATKQWHIWKLW